MATPTRGAVRQVKPLLSLDHAEAKRRVLNLYRAWYRQVPYIRKYCNFSFRSLTQLIKRLNFVIPNLKIFSVLECFM